MKKFQEFLKWLVFAFAVLHLFFYFGQEYVSNTFSTTTAGEYVFHATYLETNENSANEVTITAQ